MTQILFKIDELISELECVKRPKKDMEIGLFIIDLKTKRTELEKLHYE